MVIATSQLIDDADEACEEGNHADGLVAERLTHHSSGESV
jgi:hypothetical protein